METATAFALERVTDGLTPSAAKRAEEQLDRNLQIIDFLDEFASQLQQTETCLGTAANCLELLGDSLVELEAKGLLRRRGDVFAVRQWFQSRAARLRIGSQG